MKTIIIQINNNKALEILESLKKIDLISFIIPSVNKDKKQITILKPKNRSKKDSFLNLAGIWEGRKIDIKTLRAKAWPERK